jgi:hypothetical protein
MSSLRVAHPWAWALQGVSLPRFERSCGKQLCLTGEVPGLGQRPSEISPQLRHNPTFSSNKKGKEMTQQSMITENQAFTFKLFRQTSLKSLKRGSPWLVKQVY